MQSEYRKYLRSKSWTQKRDATIAKRKKCNRCNSRHSLIVHHKNRKARWYHEKAKDLEVLCKSCHYKEHEKEIEEEQSSKKEERQRKENSRNTFYCRKIREMNADTVPVTIDDLFYLHTIV